MTTIENNDDAKLKVFLRNNIIKVPLPEDFVRKVWIRIREQESEQHWLVYIVQTFQELISTRAVVAFFALLICSGILLGIVDGMKMKAKESQTRYVELIVPSEIRW